MKRAGSVDTRQAVFQFWHYLLRHVLFQSARDTWPGELIVGRIVQAHYRRMGVTDLVVQSAEEYVRKAVQVATDRDYRKYVTERIPGQRRAVQRPGSRERSRKVLRGSVGHAR